MIDPNNPFLRQPIHRRIINRIVTISRAIWQFTWRVPLAMYRQLRASPLAIRIPLIITAILGLAGTGYYLVSQRAERVRKSQTVVAWQEFETKARMSSDVNELLRILDRVQELNPNDPNAARRRAALIARSADADDPGMIYVMLRLNLQEGRTEAAAREAEKQLAHQPNDYLSHCARAAYLLLAQGDRAAAAPHLNVLANPDIEGANPDPSGLLFALKLLAADGRDTASVRDFLIRRVVPVLRRDRIAQAPPGAQAALIACYAEAFAAGSAAVPTLAEHWAPAARLASLALDGGTQAADANALGLLAEQGPKLAAGLNLIRAANQVTEAERAALSEELENRTRAAWQAVIALKPDSPIAYHGLALSYLRSNQPGSAWQTVLDGVQACGDDIRLFSLVSVLLMSADRADMAMNELLAAAERNPHMTTWWLLAAEAAMAANRRDLALKACQKARENSPDSMTLVFLEARLWLAGGYPEKAAELLAKIPPASVARDAASAQVYARAMIEAGRPEKVNELLVAAEAVSNAANSPNAITAALYGMFNAPPDLERAALVADRAGSVLARWSADPQTALLRAEALGRKLELDPQNWDITAVRSAIRAYERAVALNPTNLQAATGLAWLRLRGTDEPRQALKDAASLIAAENRLSVESAEVLAAVYLANDRVEDAIRLLEQARRSRQVTAGCLVLLARAYHSRGRLPEARSVLAAAASLPQTAREQIDYQSTASLLQRDLR
jgi:tetratricopeptide (TPR) repeat protein